MKSETRTYSVKDYVKDNIHLLTAFGVFGAVFSYMVNVNNLLGAGASLIIFLILGVELYLETEPRERKIEKTFRLETLELSILLFIFSIIIYAYDSYTKPFLFLLVLLLTAGVGLLLYLGKTYIFMKLSWLPNKREYNFFMIMLNIAILVLIFQMPVNIDLHKFSDLFGVSSLIVGLMWFIFFTTADYIGGLVKGRKFSFFELYRD